MKPYHKFILVLLFLNLSVTVFAQIDSDTARINFIKTQYADINKNLKSYRKVVKTDTSETTEGNEVHLYFEGNEIKKIEAIYYGETGKAVDEYYFSNMKLIFSYFVEYRYELPIAANNGKVKIASTKEKRFYFKDDKIFLIKLKPITNDGKVNTNSLTFNTQKEARRLMSL